jgi:hypothetical protein
MKYKELIIKFIAFKYYMPVLKILKKKATMASLTSSVSPLIVVR